jgi:hypothetical protein
LKAGQVTGLIASAIKWLKLFNNSLINQESILFFILFFVGLKENVNGCLFSNVAFASMMNDQWVKNI